MGMQKTIDFSSLDSFDNLLETSNLSRVDRIKRDLNTYIIRGAGSVFMDRSSGSLVYFMENDENYLIYDLLIKVRLVEMVAKYNLTVPVEFGAISSAEMVVIERQGNRVDIKLGFFPLANPTIDSLKVLQYTFGGSI